MAATKEGPLSAKAQGVATFIQFSRSSGLQQMLIVSEAQIEGENRPSYLLLRQITEESKRRPWDVRVAPDSYAAEKDPAVRAAKALEFFSKWMKLSFDSGSWTQKGAPIMVEVAAQDYADLKESKPPTGLISRIRTITTMQEEEEANA